MQHPNARYPTDHMVAGFTKGLVAFLTGTSCVSGLVLARKELEQMPSQAGSYRFCDGRKEMTGVMLTAVWPLSLAAENSL